MPRKPIEVALYLARRLMSWSRAFDDPIITSDGTELVTLRDGIAWLAKRPKARHNNLDIQLAARLLTDAAENGGILVLAEIAMRRVAGHKQGGAG